MIVILLLTTAATAYGDAYATGPSAQSQVAPAPAAYGSPYGSISNSFPAPPQPIQIQPFPTFAQQQRVPMEMQHVGVSGYPLGYGMFGTSQLGQNPYQMYSQHPLPSPLYVNYPQNMETFGAMRQSQQTGIPAAASAYLSVPTSVSSAPHSGYSTQATASTPGFAGSTLSHPGFTPPSGDPWAALGGVTTKKAEERKKKDGEGTFA